MAWIENPAAPDELEADAKGGVTTRREMYSFWHPDIKQWVDEIAGIVVLSGRIEKDHKKAIVDAVDEHFKDIRVDRVVFDFKDVVFIDADLMREMIGILLAVYKQIKDIPYKDMSIRDAGFIDLELLLINTKLADRFVIEEKDEPDYIKSSKHDDWWAGPSDPRLFQ